MLTYSHKKSNWTPLTNSDCPTGGSPLRNLCLAFRVSLFSVLSDLPSPSPTASKKAKESFLHAVEDFVVKDFLPEIETVIEAEIPSAAPTVSAISQLFERAFHSFRSRKVAQAPVAQAPAAAAPVTAATATAVQIQPAESGVMPVGSTAV